MEHLQWILLPAAVACVRDSGILHIICLNNFSNFYTPYRAIFSRRTYFAHTPCTIILQILDSLCMYDATITEIICELNFRRPG